MFRRPLLRNVLAIDASGDRMSMALICPPWRMRSMGAPARHAQCEMLPVWARELLDRQEAPSPAALHPEGPPPKDQPPGDPPPEGQPPQAPVPLHAVAVTLGPGSYSGLRVGLAMARALALACRVPLLGLDSFTLWAYRYAASGVRGRPSAGHTLVVALNLRRHDIAVRRYRVPPRGWPVCRSAPESVRQPDFSAWLARRARTGPLVCCGEIPPEGPWASCGVDPLCLADPEAPARTLARLARRAPHRFVRSRKLLTPLWLHPPAIQSPGAARVAP